MRPTQVGDIQVKNEEIEVMFDTIVHAHDPAGTGDHISTTNFFFLNQVISIPDKSVMHIQKGFMDFVPNAVWDLDAQVHVVVMPANSDEDLIGEKEVYKRAFLHALKMYIIGTAVGFMMDRIDPRNEPIELTLYSAAQQWGEDAISVFMQATADLGPSISVLTRLDITIFQFQRNWNDTYVRKGERHTHGWEDHEWEESGPIVYTNQ